MKMINRRKKPWPPTAAAGGPRGKGRRSMAVGVLFALFALAFPLDPASSATASQPNIVLILADDLGYGDLGCYGQKTLKTPHLDRMAEEGMRFTRHYAGSTVCAPSRAVLLTGLHLGHAPLRTNWDEPLPSGTPTIASVLQKAGYRTGCFGKWGVGFTIPEGDPNQKGFDEFFGYVDMFHAHNFFPPFLVRNGRRVPLSNGLVEGSDFGRDRGNGIAQNPTEYGPGLVVDEALKFIDENFAAPFFLYMPLNTPHANNEGGKFGKGDRGMEVPGFGPFAAEDWPAPEKGFAKMVSDIDRDVARVLARLKEHRVDGNTLVIFTSDNGPHQEGGHQVETFDSNGLLRGHKRDLFEGGIRVPMIAWWPGTIPAGGTSDHLSGFQDYLPTFCELAGVKAPECDGLSMVECLEGRPGKQARHPFLYWEFYESGGKQAVVDQKWKAVRLNWIKAPEGPLKLYDLDNDLGETHNVARLHPEVVAKMRERMDTAHIAHTGIVEKP